MIVALPGLFSYLFFLTERIFCLSFSSLLSISSRSLHLNLNLGSNIASAILRYCGILESINDLKVSTILEL